jgi:hypothetical protein
MAAKKGNRLKPADKRRKIRPPKRLEDEDSASTRHEKAKKRRRLNEKEEEAAEGISGLSNAGEQGEGRNEQDNNTARQDAPPKKQSKTARANKARGQKKYQHQLTAARAQRCRYGTYRINPRAELVTDVVIGARRYFQKAHLHSITGDGPDITLEVGSQLTANLNGELLTDLEVWALHVNLDGVGRVQITTLDPRDRGKALPVERVGLSEVCAIQPRPIDWDRKARDTWWKSYSQSEKVDCVRRRAAKSAPKSPSKHSRPASPFKAKIPQAQRGLVATAAELLKVNVTLLQELAAERKAREADRKAWLAEAREASRLLQDDILKTAATMARMIQGQ